MFAPLPEQEFGVILADPPWKFVTFNGRKSVPCRTKDDPYPTMVSEDLAKLPVVSVAAKNCVLLMWVLDSHLKQAIALGEAWGFAYKTRAFTWDKGAMGMGYWTRKQTEICLLFTRGKPGRKGRGVRDLIRAPRREHSRKPDEQYERIEALLHGPYLELFARQSRLGWSAWGNQSQKFDPAETPSGINTCTDQASPDTVNASSPRNQCLNHAVIPNLHAEVADLLGFERPSDPVRDAPVTTAFDVMDLL